MDWEQKYPLVSVHTMQRAVSDHMPLLVDSAEATHMGNKNIFSFELSWLEKDIEICLPYLYNKEPTLKNLDLRIFGLHIVGTEGNMVKCR